MQVSAKSERVGVKIAILHEISHGMTLQFMPDEDFKTFSRQFELPTEHALLEAIRCVTEAAKYCVHTPLFYAKNKVSLNFFYTLHASFYSEPSSWPSSLCSLFLDLY